MTAQVHENLIYEGEETTMMSCPPLPAEHPLIVMTDPPGTFAKPGVPSFVFSAACWRGYLGTWEVREGRLYLVSLVGRYEMLGDEPVFAEWVSGVLRIPRGELLEYVHMGFESVYERELRLRVEAGVVVESTTVEAAGAVKKPLSPRGWRHRLRSLFRR